MVGIETDRGPWVQRCVAAGYQVFAINPLSAARYRERHSTSGAKSDAGDAHVLAEIVRTGSGSSPRVAGDSDLAEAIKLLARAHQTAIWERTRHVLRLRQRCWSTFPPLCRHSRICQRRTRWSCSARPPDPDRAARLTRGQLLPRSRADRRTRGRQSRRRCRPCCGHQRCATCRRAGAYAAMVPRRSG